MDISQILNGVGIIPLIGVVIWLVRLEAAVKNNANSTTRAHTRLDANDKLTFENDKRLVRLEDKMDSIDSKLDKVCAKLEVI